MQPPSQKFIPCFNNKQVKTVSQSMNVQKAKVGSCFLKPDIKQEQHKKELGALQPIVQCQNTQIQIQNKVQDSGKINQKLVVLIGIIGAGKTTLFNKITKSKCPAQAGGASVTQCIFSKESAYGLGFKILDTPGLGVLQDKLLHACSIRSALSEGPISRIIIVVKAERTDQMESHLKNMLKQQFEKYRHIITIVVTFWDHIETENKELLQNIQNGITEMIQRYNVHSVLYVSKLTTGKDLCKEIDKILLQSESTQVQISNEEFYKNFDIYQCPDQIEVQLNEARAKVTVEFRQLSHQIRTFIAQFDDKNSYMPDIMHALTLDIKQIAEQIIQKFETENQAYFSKLFDQLDDPNLSFIIDTELKKELKEEVSKLINQAQKKMKFNESHCFNLIKRCPFCHIVWLKVIGCNGETQCGLFPEQDSEQCQIQQVPRKFKFNISAEKIEVIQLETQNNFNAKIYKDSKGLKGCGKRFIWSDVPQLTEGEMRDLIDPGLQDFLTQQVNSEKEKWIQSLEKQVQAATQKVKRVNP